MAALNIASIMFLSSTYVVHTENAVSREKETHGNPQWKRPVYCVHSPSEIVRTAPIRDQMALSATGTILRFTVRWTAADVTSHTCQSSAVNMSCNYAPSKSLRPSRRSHDIHTASYWFRWLVAPSTVRHKVKKI